MVVISDGPLVGYCYFSQLLCGCLDSSFLEAVGHKGTVHATRAKSDPSKNGFGPSNITAKLGTFLLGQTSPVPDPPPPHRYCRCPVPQGNAPSECCERRCHAGGILLRLTRAGWAAAVPGGGGGRGCVWYLVVRAVRQHLRHGATEAGPAVLRRCTLPSGGAPEIIRSAPQRRLRRHRLWVAVVRRAPAQAPAAHWHARPALRGGRGLAPRGIAIQGRPPDAVALRQCGNVWETL